MNQMFGKTMVLAAAVLFAGCSSTQQRGGIRVAHSSGYGTTTHDRSYATPAYDRGEITGEHTMTVVTPVEPSNRVQTVSMTGASFGYDVTVDEIRQHMRNQSAVLVDAREPREFKKGHVRGAINIPSGEEDAYMGTFRKEVASDQLVIVYCGSPQCPASEQVSSFLSSQGYYKVRIYKPGWQQLSRVELP